MRNVLVTGATGYIGGRLIPRLIERGDTAVRVMVRGHEPILGRPWEGMVDVAVGDAALQVAVDVLNVFRFAAVDVPRQVEVVVVLGVFDFRDRDHASVAWIGFILPVESVNDAVDVLLAEPVFVSVFDEAFGGVDHEDALAGGGALLVEDDDARWDAGAVKEVGG